MSEPEKEEAKTEEPSQEKEEIEEGKAAEAVTEEEAEESVEQTVEEEGKKPEKTALEEEMKEAEAVEEEEKEKPKREEEKEEDIVEEKFYTIPLRRAWITPPQRRAPRAIRIIKGYVQKHMKIGAKKEEEETGEEEEEERLIISSELNERIWERGIRKPPRKVKVRVVKDSEGNVTVYPA